VEILAQHRRAASEGDRAGQTQWLGQETDHNRKQWLGQETDHNRKQWLGQETGHNRKRWLGQETGHNTWDSAVSCSGGGKGIGT